jgi:hypothetical protein
VSRADVFVSDEPPAEADASSVLDALLRAGRWGDAAAYCVTVTEMPPVDRAALLLVADRAEEADRLLATQVVDAGEPMRWVRFLQGVSAVMHGNSRGLPDLITESERLPGHVLIPVLMLRAADFAGQSEVSAHFGGRVLRFNPGDPDAARAFALGLVNQGDYVSAVRLLDHADAARCVDERSALDGVLDRLRTSHAQMNALVTIGRYLHREKDPTLPVTDVVRAARRRWRNAYRSCGTPYWGRRLAWLATVAAMLGSLLIIGNALPGLAVTVAVGAWLRLRPLPGLDVRTSQLVRAVSDPRTILLARHYRAFDVFTFIFVAIVAGGLATRLPSGPAWVGAVATIAVLAIAAATTRGRRRWVRYQRQRLLRPTYDPAMCTCLDVASVQGPQSRDYVDQHLFQAGAVRNRPDWRVLQCLGTHTRFLDLPLAQLTIRLTVSPSEDLSD